MLAALNCVCSTCPRHEGPAKVTGEARYTTDVHYPEMLVAKYLGSAHTHARIVNIDFEAALAIDGVEAVIDVLGDPHRQLGTEAPEASSSAPSSMGVPSRSTF